MRIIKEIAMPVLIAVISAVVLYSILAFQSDYTLSVDSGTKGDTKNIKLVSTRDSGDSSKVRLSVPYIPEAPDGIWVGAWKNACEEASVAMVEFFYRGNSQVSVNTAKSYMQKLFDFQDETFGSNANSDAQRTLAIIQNKSTFSGRIVENPSIEDIKKEVKEGRPVITFHKGFDLKNPNIPFLASGSSYHSMVVIGYDDSKGSFIVNDNGDEVEGSGYLYEYDLFMNSIHDYDYIRMKADGPVRVIFTNKK